MDIRRKAICIIVVMLSWSLMVQGAPVTIRVTTEQKSNLDSFPENSLFILHIGSLPRLISNLKKSVVYKTLMDFVESETFEKLRKSEEEADAIVEAVTSIIDGAPNAFTGQFTFGFLGFVPQRFLMPELMLIADAREKQLIKYIEDVQNSVLEKISGDGRDKLVFGKSGDFGTIGPEDEGDPLLYKTDGTRILIGLTESSFRLINKTKKPISQNIIFKNTVRQLGLNPDILGFINLKEIIAINDPGGGIDSELAMLTGFDDSIQGIGFSCTTRENVIIDDIVLYSTKGLTGITGLLNRPGSGPSIEKYIPENYLCVARLSTGSFEEIYKEFFKFLDSLGEDLPIQKEWHEGVKELEDEIGFSIKKDLLPALGGDIGFAMKAPKALTIPEMVGLIEVKDQQKLQKLIDTAIPEDVTFTTSAYKGVTIHSTGARLVKPSYAFIDTYLVIATSPDVIKEILDTRVAGRSIMDKEDYKKVFETIPDTGILVAYIDSKKAIDSLVPLALARMGISGEDTVENDMPSSDLLWKEFFTALQNNTRDISGDGFVLTADKNTVHLRHSSGVASLTMLLPVGMFGFWMLPIGMGMH